MRLGSYKLKVMISEVDVRKTKGHSGKESWKKNPKVYSACRHGGNDMNAVEVVSEFR